MRRTRNGRRSPSLSRTPIWIRARIRREDTEATDAAWATSSHSGESSGNSNTTSPPWAWNPSVTAGSPPEARLLPAYAVPLPTYAAPPVAARPPTAMGHPQWFRAVASVRQQSTYWSIVDRRSTWYPEAGEGAANNPPIGRLLTDSHRPEASTSPAHSLTRTQRRRRRSGSAVGPDSARPAGLESRDDQRTRAGYER